MLSNRVTIYNRSLLYKIILEIYKAGQLKKCIYHLSNYVKIPNRQVWRLTTSVLAETTVMTVIPWKATGTLPLQRIKI